MVELKILEHHEGEFWTLARTARQVDPYSRPEEVTVGHSTKTRISNLIFTDSIPGPRDVIIICLINTCDVFRFMFKLDDEAEKRINFICEMDLIGRAIAEAVVHNVAAPMLKRAHLTKPIPFVRLRDLLRSPHVRNGNLPALFAELAKKHGPVYRLPLPSARRMIFLAGPQINHWSNRPRAHVPQSPGLLCRLRAGLWCLRGPAFPGWRRPFPASKGHGAGLFAKKAARPGE